MPLASRFARCALTAPFHPYRSIAQTAVCSLWHFPSACAGRALPATLSPWSPDFPPTHRYQYASGCPTVWTRQALVDLVEKYKAKSKRHQKQAKAETPDPEIEWPDNEAAEPCANAL